MSMEGNNAFSALNQLIIPNFQNNAMPTTKMPEEGVKMDDQMLQILQNMPFLNNIQQMLIQTNQIPTDTESVEKPSPSNDSDSSRAANSPLDLEKDGSTSPNNTTIQSGNDANSSNGKSQSSSRTDGWFECFTTTLKSEYDALIYSLYVIEKDDRKMDGWQYFECINRLQNKCRFKLRVKQQDEFYIVEEKGGHNHGIEPVGQAGSHAGLPKTLREIVDKSFNENWPQEIRTTKIDEEIRRLGLPPNPRLGRQIDNRVAYLRRVKNLQESKKIQDHLSAMNTTTPSNTSSMFDPQIMQMLMENGADTFSLMEKLRNNNMKEEEQEEAENVEMAQQPMQMEIAQPMGAATTQPDPSMVLQQLIEQQKLHQNEQAVQFIQQALPNLEMMTPQFQQ